MATAYITFYLQAMDAATGRPTTTLDEDTLGEVGHQAWKRLDKSLSNWPGRMVTVPDHDMNFEVEALELCEDDTGLVEAAQQRAGAEGLCYGLGTYTEQMGLTLTEPLLVQTQAMAVAAFQEALDEHAGPNKLVAKLLTVERMMPLSERLRGSNTERGSDAAALMALPADECLWVAGNGTLARRVYFSRTEALAALVADKPDVVTIQAFSATGALVQVYLRDPQQADGIWALTPSEA